jgi:hypothetical protein
MKPYLMESSVRGMAKDGDEYSHLRNQFLGINEAKKIVYRLCGLVVRVPGYRSRGPGFDSRRYQIF